MADKKIPLGPTGEAVRQNVAAWRQRRNLAIAELARRLDTLGRPIPILGLTRIEKGDRRVDADDLMALAAALDVPPATLLMPVTEAAADMVETTGHPAAVPASELWDYLCGQQMLPGSMADSLDSDLRADRAQFRWPSWVFLASVEESKTRSEEASQGLQGLRELQELRKFKARMLDAYADLVKEFAGLESDDRDNAQAQE